jgi:hypothetical protein
MHWFSRDWWAYLLAPKAKGYSWREVVWCRMRCHPAGVFWFNTGGLEPDMRCQGCGDDLG